jgi:hypothetical protein
MLKTTEPINLQVQQCWELQEAVARSHNGAAGTQTRLRASWVRNVFVSRQGQKGYFSVLIPERFRSPPSLLAKEN